MAANFHVPDWVSASNMYEVNVRQYTTEGTFAAFEKHLPRLKNMGVDILWFMPITPVSIQNRQGTLGSYYATSNYTLINPEFGTLHDFKRLVHQAHQLGLKVMMDWVANHTGYDHIWTKTNPEYYKRNAAGNFYDAYDWCDVIDLDYANGDMRRAMLLAMQFWVEECDIDGFRCDMAHLVPLDFWLEARQHLSQIKKHLFWLAESETINYQKAFDALYGWELLHVMEAVAQGKKTLPALEDVLNKYASDAAGNVLHLSFTSNHDENSHSGSEYERMGDAAKAFAVLTSTWANCLPLVYSGQEIPNKKRLLFFDKDEIDWSGECWLNNFYKSLFEARKSCSALHYGNGPIERIHTNADDKVFAFKRRDQESEIVVFLHLSATALVRFKVEDDDLQGWYKSIFSGIDYQFGQPHFIEMTAWEYLVYVR